MRYVRDTTDLFQSDQVGRLSEVVYRIDALRSKLKADVRNALELPENVEISTWACLSKRSKMTAGIAFRAALLFQISHRFFSQTQRKRRVDCPAVTEYNGPDPSRYEPPRGWAVDDQMQIQTRAQQRTAVDQHNLTVRDSSTTSVCAAGSRRTGAHGRGADAAAAARASADLNRIPVNPAPDPAFFAAAMSAIDTSFPKPVLPDGFKFDGVGVSSYDRASALLALAVFFDPRQQKDPDRTRACTRFLHEHVNELKSMQETIEDSDDDDGPSSDLDTSLDRHLNNAPKRQHVSRLEPDQQLDAEIEAYSALGGISRSMTVVQFWETDGRKFSLLAPLALAVGTVPCSSAGIERVFSMARNMTLYNQFNQSPSKLRDRLMMHYNRAAVDAWLDRP